MVVVAGGAGGEDGAALHPVRHVVADRLPQTVVLVSRVVHREQSPVLGVEHEEQPVEKDEGCVTKPNSSMVTGTTPHRGSPVKEAT